MKTKKRLRYEICMYARKYATDVLLPPFDALFKVGPPLEKKPSYASDKLHCQDSFKWHSWTLFWTFCLPSL